MNLSENQELVQKLQQILEDYPGLEYDKCMSVQTDDTLVVKVLPDIACDINTAAIIARKLHESTGDFYKVQPNDDSDGSALDNLRSFRLFLLKPNRNVRITYPDSKDGELEVDIIQGVEMSLNVEDPQLWHFAKDNELEIHFNTFARPNYRGYLNSHVTRVTRNYNESPDENTP